MTITHKVIHQHLIFSYPSDSYSIDPSITIRNVRLDGEFRSDADFSTLTYDDYLEAKHHVLNRKPHDINFYYSDDELPGHSQNSGVLRPDESEIHFGNLDKVNLEMPNNISAIQVHNKNAIIVVRGDHGPYLRKIVLGLAPMICLKSIDWILKIDMDRS